MKKFLGMILAASLFVSMLTFPVAAAGSDSSTNQTEAAAVLQMMGAMQGDENGALNLSDTLTRAQFCKIAVVVMGLGNKVSQYTGYTIFPDVPSSSWEAGYINLAVRYAGIMSGYTNGYFGPDDTVTYAQAVTVMMRILGYKSSDVGATWPDDYLNKANEIGLTDGLGLGSSANISRGEAAVLFANVLNTYTNGTTKIYASTISNTTMVSNVFLVSNSAKTDDGKKGAVEITGESSGTYLPMNTVPKSLVGKFGTLIVNSSGKAVVFVPSSTGKTVSSSVSSATSTAITCSDGSKITMTSSPTFYFDGSLASYSSKWYSISGGMLVSAYYSEGGNVQYVVVSIPDSGSDSTTVVSSSYSASASNALYYKNGSLASSSDICTYDVVTYNSEYNVYNITDKKVSGRYEDAYPNSETPSTVKVLGAEFEVLESAIDSLSNFDIGDSVTLLLTEDDKVAGAVSSIETNVGIVAEMTSSSATVKLINGITVSEIPLYSGSDLFNNMIVTVTSATAGYFRLIPLSSTLNYGTLDLEAGTLGDKKISPCVKIYDSVDGASAVLLDKDDIISTTVSSSKILYAGYDQGGNVDVILLDDATGDAFTYGQIDKTTKTTNSGGISVTNPVVTVTNSDGESSFIGNSTLTVDSFAGVSSDGDGHVKASKTLTEQSGMSRSDFKEDEKGNISVTVGDTTISVSNNVQAYISSSETWTTLSNARRFSNNLSVFYDTIGDHPGKVRVVIAY